MLRMLIIGDQTDELNICFQIVPRMMGKGCLLHQEYPNKESIREAGKVRLVQPRRGAKTQLVQTGKVQPRDDV